MIVIRTVSKIAHRFVFFLSMTSLTLHSADLRDHYRFPQSLSPHQSSAYLQGVVVSERGIETTVGGICAPEGVKTVPLVKVSVSYSQIRTEKERGSVCRVVLDFAVEPVAVSHRVLLSVRPVVLVESLGKNGCTVLSLYNILV